MTKLTVKTGQFLEIHEIIGSGDSQRVWKFRGIVYAVNNPSHPNGTFLIRGVSSGIIVERIYPLSFPKFDKVILLDEFKVRRAKLYYLRDKVGKGARLKSLISPERRNIDLLTQEVVEIDSPAQVPTELVEAPTEPQDTTDDSK